MEYQVGEVESMVEPSTKFQRSKDGKTHSSKILRRKKSETKEQFLSRMNKVGYNNGELEKLTAHWNRDASEYHVGANDSCKRCATPRTKASTRGKKDIRYEMPTKVGNFRKLSDGSMSVLFRLSPEFAQIMQASPVQSIRVSVDQSISSDVAEHTATPEVKDSSEVKSEDESGDTISSSTSLPEAGTTEKKKDVEEIKEGDD